MDEFYNKHYITVDEKKPHHKRFFNTFCQSTDTDTYINEQGNYQRRLF